MVVGFITVNKRRRVGQWRRITAPRLSKDSRIGALTQVVGRSR